MDRQESIADHLNSAILFHNYVIEKHPNGTYKSTPRNSLFMALCDIAHEHHGAIIVLVRNHQQHLGSALALLRPLIETCIRAFWIVHCADDPAIESILRQTAGFPTLQKCGESVNAHFEAEGFPNLFSLSKEYRNQLHGLTHSGLEQLQHRFDGQLTVKPSYLPKTICKLLKDATMWLAMAAIAQLVFIEGSDSSESQRFSRKYVELFEHS